MNKKQIREFIEWLGLNYLDFDNNGKDYKKSTTEEITDKIKELTKNKTKCIQK